MIPRKFYEAEEGGGGISKPDIPENIKKQIELKYAYAFASEWCKGAAEYGYNLSQQQITSLQDRVRELEKENERLKGLAKEQWMNANRFLPHDSSIGSRWEKFKAQHNL